MKENKIATQLRIQWSCKNNRSKRSNERVINKDWSVTKFSVHTSQQVANNLSAVNIFSLFHSERAFNWKFKMEKSDSKTRDLLEIIDPFENPIAIGENFGDENAEPQKSMEKLDEKFMVNELKHRSRKRKHREVDEQAGDVALDERRNTSRHRSKRARNTERKTRVLVKAFESDGEDNLEENVVIVKAMKRGSIRARDKKTKAKGSKSDRKSTSSGDKRAYLMDVDLKQDACEKCGGIMILKKHTNSSTELL